jgi:DNA-binding NarL/FixJ family response regulator
VDNQPLRVIIAEDSALIREGLARLITDSGGVVVAKVGDGPSLVAAVEEHRPDVSVVDVRMPPTQRDEGLRAAIEARHRVPGTPVLVLSQYVEREYATELLADRAGGVGYLLKDRVADIREFMDALRRVARGGTALDPEVVAQLMVPRHHDDRLHALTPREREVLAAMAGDAPAWGSRAAVRLRGRHREAHHQHLRQAGPARLRERPPAGPGGPRLPRLLILRRSAGVRDTRARFGWDPNGRAHDKRPVPPPRPPGSLGAWTASCS